MTAKIENNLSILLIREWLDILWYIHAAEYYAAIKKNN